MTRVETPMLRTLLILVPKAGTSPGRTIDRGSGIVADAAAVAELVDVYFEGNRFGSPSMHTFEQKVFHAAGRLAQRYPTIARGRFRLADFDTVGTYQFSEDWQDKQMVITNPERLRAWEGK
jgi:hypothetical protein